MWATSRPLEFTLPQRWARTGRCTSRRPRCRRFFPRSTIDGAECCGRWTARRGRTNWEFWLGGSYARSSPAIGADGTIYVGSDAGVLYALKGSTNRGLAHSSWPKFLGNRQNTGRVRDAGLGDDYRIWRLTGAWHVTTPAGSGTVGFTEGLGRQCPVQCPPRLLGGGRRHGVCGRHGQPPDPGGECVRSGVDSGGQRYRRASRWRRHRSAVRRPGGNMPRCPRQFFHHRNQPLYPPTRPRRAREHRGRDRCRRLSGWSRRERPVQMRLAEWRWMAAATCGCADFNNHAVRQIAPDGTVSTWVGNGTAGSQDGPRAGARLNQPAGIALGSSGSLCVSEWGGHRIRLITAAGQVTTLAGSGVPGCLDGDGTSAAFNHPDGLIGDATGAFAGCGFGQFDGAPGEPGRPNSNGGGNAGGGVRRR